MVISCHFLNLTTWFGLKYPLYVYIRRKRTSPIRQGAAPCAFAHASPVMAVTCGGKSDGGWARSLRPGEPLLSSQSIDRPLNHEISTCNVFYSSHSNSRSNLIHLMHLMHPIQSGVFLVKTRTRRFRKSPFPGMRTRS